MRSQNSGEEITNPQNLDLQDPINLLVFLGPYAMGKRGWMRFVVESFPKIFCIVKVFTTKPPETWEDRPFYTYIPGEEFCTLKDLDGDEDEFFWATYERHEGDEMFLYGFSYQDISNIPEGMCGILTLDSPALFLQLQEALQDNNHITLRCIRILPYNIPDGNDILSQNLRRLGITDERVIMDRGELAERFEAETHHVKGVIVYITGNTKADARHIKNAVNAA